MSDPTQRGLAAANHEPATGRQWVAIACVAWLLAGWVLGLLTASMLYEMPAEPEVHHDPARLEQLRKQHDRIGAQLDELERRERMDLYHSTGEVGP